MRQKQSVTREALNMSAENWLQAAKSEEERLLAEIAKTTLYRQLEAVRAVLAVYEGTTAVSEAEQAGASAAASARTNGATSPRSFKTATAFSGAADPAADSGPRPRPQ
jgi:hypothetical protein